jgi:uncharacterized protein
MDLIFDFSLLWLTLFFMLIGLIGLVVPIFPGLFVIWLSALGYGVLAGFGILGTVLMVLITISMLVGSLVDNFFSGTRALGQGASWLAIGVGLACGVIGTFIFPPFGGIILAPLGILVVEFLRKRDLRHAFRATRGWAVGCSWAYGVRLLAGILMIELWVLWVLWG